MPLKQWNPKDFPEDQELGMPAWENCHVKELLCGDLKAGVVPLVHDAKTMCTRETFLSRPECKMHGFKNFYSRLASLRSTMADGDSQVKRDSKAFDIFKKNYPPKKLCSRGHLHWEGSDAQKQLTEDIDDGCHETMTPQELWESEPDACTLFPQDVFRWHIHQELKTRKCLHHLKVKDEVEKELRLEKHTKALERIKAREQKQKEKQHVEGLVKHSKLRKKLHEDNLIHELLWRGAGADAVNSLRTFTKHKKKLQEMELQRVKDEPEWKQKAAEKGFKKLSDAPFAMETNETP